MNDERPALPLEIECRAVQKLLKRHDDVVLLDCRERHEFEIVHLEGATLIPMSEIGDRAEEILQRADEHLIVYCHHGGRSLQVAKWLRDQGLQQVQSMAGGIDLWAQDIDPTLARYE